MNVESLLKRYSCTNCSCWEYKSALSVWLWFKNSKLIPQWSYHIHSITFLPWSSAFVLYIDLRPGQTCHSKVMHRKEVTHSDGSYEKKLHRQIWLTKWDKVKAHDTLIDWCTGREWPLNCMTVISVWWWSNMTFQRLSGRLNYYITQWTQEVSELEIRRVGEDVVGKATTQQKGPLGPPVELEIRWVRDKMW